jgi:biopolymer transport protein TolR
VVLKADRAVRYAEVRHVFKTLQDAGFPGISLQVIDLKK